MKRISYILLIALFGCILFGTGCEKHEFLGKKFDNNDQIFTLNGIPFTMKPVEGGTFWMGAQNTDPSGQNYNSEAGGSESPVHQVTLSSFYMGETEVTQALWLAVMGSWPGTSPSSTYGVGNNYPAYYVSWNDVQNFITQLNALFPERTFRLPTEAEWEFAARGGNFRNGNLYSGGITGWYAGNSSGKTHTVESLNSNELGLYDMSGNVWEWCSDWSGYYSSSNQTNPTGASTYLYRVLRGGSWNERASSCRVACRFCAAPHYYSNDIGFRIVLVP